jgi:hypothetical protein
VSEAIARAGTLRIARRTLAAGAANAGGPRPSMPLVAVLGSCRHAAVGACAMALALTRACGAASALAGAVGVLHRQPHLGGLPAARGSAARLRARGLPAVAVGRLVWVALEDACDDETGLAAAMAATLGRAAAAVRAPAALALPLARTEALDRVLAWHDAFVVVREPDMPDVLVESALASLARLGRPVATMPVLSRVDAALAAGGLRAPAEAIRAGELLGFRGDGGRPRG